MRYYVVWPDGQRFGPADIPTLQRWIAENRVGPGTMLAEEIGGRTLPATALPELQPLLSLPPGAYRSAPGTFPASPYYRQQSWSSNESQAETIAAWILGGIGVASICMIPCPCLAPALCVTGLILAALGVRKRQPSAVGALWLCIIGTLLSLGIFLLLTIGFSL